jgi:DNA-binding FadR family transcriptional regulator
VLGTPSIGVARVFEGLLGAGCASARELLEIRVVLDSSAAALASTMPKSAHAGIAAVLTKMRETADPLASAALDTDFHRAVVEASGNRLFVLIFQALKEPIQSQIESHCRSDQQQGREETLEHHTAIYNAIHRGDAQIAAQKVREHLSAFYLPGFAAPERTRLRAFMKAMES